MDVADHVRARQAQQFVVALHVLVEVLETLAAVLRLAQLEALDHGAHGTVEDGDALREDGGQRLGAGVDGRFHAPIVGRHRRTHEACGLWLWRQGPASAPMR